MDVRLVVNRGIVWPFLLLVNADLRVRRAIVEVRGSMLETNNETESLAKIQECVCRCPVRGIPRQRGLPRCVHRDKT